jgi:hypothetical protein
MALDAETLYGRLVDGNAKISDILPEAKIFASQHQFRGLEDWIDDELNGYRSGRKVPDYRHVVGTPKWSRDGRNWGELRIENRELEEILSGHLLNHPIDELERYAGSPSSDRTFVLPFPIEAIRGAAAHRINLPDRTGVQITSHEFARVVRAVRNELLSRLLAIRGQVPVESPTNTEFDAFICHASDDKEEFVRPLAERLKKCGLKIWFDEFTLTIGDSLRRSIDRGLANSRFGIVVISPSFGKNILDNSACCLPK